MTDEHNPPQEPEPGSTDWLLAQLSGGRLDSRRERREAEAALEARGVQFDAETGAITLPGQGDAQQPGSGEAADADAVEADADGQQTGTDAAPDERPKARFSWQTGTLEAVDPSLAASGGAPESGSRASSSSDGADALDDDRVLDDDGSLDDGVRPEAVPAAAPSPLSAASHAQAEPRLWFEDPRVPLTFDSTFTAPAAAAGSGDSDAGSEFRWNLSPTAEGDPALNPELELPESMQPAPPPVVASAPPLIVPKPLSRADASPPATRAMPQADATPVADPAPAAEASPAADSVPAPRDLPRAEPEPTAPDAPDAPESVAAATTPTLLPPGTTAHEFDPFAQDLFAPEGAAGTPVPPVAEFTIPDDERAGQASVPTQPTDGNAFLPTQAMDAQEFLPTEAMPTHDGSANVGEPESSEASDAAEGGRAGAPADAEVSSTWTDITDLLGAEPETVASSIVPEWPPPEGTFDGFAQAVGPAADAIAQAVGPAAAAARQVASRPGAAPVEHRRRLPANRWLIVVAAVLVAVLIAVLLFAIGRAVANGRNAAAVSPASHATVARSSTSVSPSPAASPALSPSATPVLPPTGTLPAGQTYQWDQLRGGECIDPFGGAWAQQYSVVACTAQHAAQLVYTAPFSSNPAAAFPGEQAIASQINLLCSRPGVIDMAAAGAYSDVQIVASYPVTAAQWAAGQRNYYCFVTRSSGQPLTTSVQGPGPAQ